MPACDVGSEGGKARVSKNMPDNPLGNSTDPLRQRQTHIRTALVGTLIGQPLYIARRDAKFCSPANPHHHPVRASGSSAIDPKNKCP